MPACQAQIAVQVGDKLDTEHVGKAHKYLPKTLLLQFLRPWVSCLVSNFREYSIFTCVQCALLCGEVAALAFATHLLLGG